MRDEPRRSRPAGRWKFGRFEAVRAAPPFPDGVRKPPTEARTERLAGHDARIYRPLRIFTGLKACRTKKKSLRFFPLYIKASPFSFSWPLMRHRSPSPNRIARGAQ